MIILKYIILILIFVCSVTVGFLISKKFKNRVEELRCFKNIMNILETKIKFTYEPLGDIFNELIKITENKKNISSIFKETIKNMQTQNITEAWKKAIESSKSNLSLANEDINILKDFGNLLRTN